MQYRKFGRLDWKVSQIGMGTWALGSDWGSQDDAESVKALHKALDLGCNFIDTARAYGPLLPVSPELLRDAADFREHDIEPLMTPGHAPHHVSYLFRDYLFGGETCGVYTELPDGDFYLRPATPPRFFLETSVKSIESLLEVPHKLFCFGHFGLTRDTPRLLEIHRQQLSDWAHIIRNQMQKAEQGPDFQDHCIDVLLQKDPLLKSWDKLGPAIQERERFFLRNSVRGYVEYLREMGH